MMMNDDYVCIYYIDDELWNVGFDDWGNERISFDKLWPDV